MNAVKEKPSLIYELDEPLAPDKLLVYGLQHLFFCLANAAVVPVVVGICLGLDSQGIASLVQRTFFFCGLASILQATWGHKYPIFEGPAGMWYGLIIILSSVAPTLGQPLEALRSNLESGLLAVAFVYIALGSTGIMVRIAKLFTPAVNGTFLVLMSLQLSNTIVKGLLGLSTPAPEISGKALIVSLLTAGCILVISLKAKGFVRTIGVLLGTTIGWITAIFLGIAPPLSNASHQLLSVPQIFAWGTPTLDPGIMITCLLTGIIVLSNFVASIAGMSKLLDTPDTPDLYNRGVIVTGISNILAGLGCVVGFIPYASAIGFIGLSGVASRLPFIVGSFMLAMLGLVAPIGTLLAAMPPAVGYAVLLTTFALVLGAGLKEYTYLSLDTRDMVVISTPLILGVGLMFVPPSAFSALPLSIRYLAGNGLIVGVLLCILLEHILLRTR